MPCRSALVALVLAGCAPEPGAPRLDGRPRSGDAEIRPRRFEGRSEVVAPDSPSRLELLPQPDPALCGIDATDKLADVTDCARVAEALHILYGAAVAGEVNVTSAVWLYLDDDPWLDLVTVSPNGWHRAYLGASNGRFALLERDGLGEDGAWAGVALDHDQDGDLDLYLVGETGDALFENVGGSFAKVPGGPWDERIGVHASVSDLDGDSLPELFVSTQACRDCAGSSICDSLGDRLWVQGTGGWEDRTVEVLGAAAADLTCGIGFASLWSDLDGDGDQDLYAVNDRGDPTVPDVPRTQTRRNTLWRNDGPGCDPICFTEVARDVGLHMAHDSMGVASADFDNDGDFDVITSDLFGSLLFRNDGASFVQVQDELGLGAHGTDDWGVVWLDYDNDGDLDVYRAASGPNSLYRNDGVAGFTDVTLETIGWDDVVSGGVSKADYDRDGRVDLVFGNMGGPYRLLRNTFDTGHHWVGLELVGAGAGGSQALGARVEVEDSSGRVQVAEVRSGSSLGAGDDHGLHFGLGDAVLVEVRVRWPDGSEEVVVPELDRWSRLTRAGAPVP